MSGKSLIFRPKRGLLPKARELLCVCVAMFAAGCFIEPDGRERPDSGVVVPVYPWPPELIEATPPEPVSTFEYMQGTQHCQFPISVRLRDRDSEELDLRLVTDNHQSYRNYVRTERVSVIDGEADEAFLVHFNDFRPEDPGDHKYHSISLFVSDTVGRWALDDEDETDLENVDFGKLEDGVEGNVLELRWSLIFKNDVCCPRELQNPPATGTMPCAE